MITFLIGKHGVGKSTIGQMMVTDGMVCRHISIGDLVRQCRRKQRGDLPFGLHLDLSMHQSGKMLPEQVAVKLLDYLVLNSSGANISVDGFPATPEHVTMLPSDAWVVHITVPNAARIERLIARAKTSVRKWSNEMPESERDSNVDQVVELCRQRGNFLTASNANSTSESLDEIKKSGQFGRKND